MTAGGLALFQEIMFNDATKKLLAPLADATEKDPIRLDDAMFYRGNMHRVEARRAKNPQNSAF